MDGLSAALYNFAYVNPESRPIIPPIARENNSLAQTESTINQLVLLPKKKLGIEDGYSPSNLQHLRIHPGALQPLLPKKRSNSSTSPLACVKEIAVKAFEKMGKQVDQCLLLFLLPPFTHRTSESNIAKQPNIFQEKKRKKDSETGRLSRP